MSGCPRGCCASYREHLLGVQWGRPAGPTEQTLKERRLARDLTAFKLAAQQGTTLRTINGAADLLDKASSQIEIDRGHLIENARLLREIEVHQASAPPPCTTPIDAA